jgi:TolB-like protein
MMTERMPATNLEQVGRIGRYVDLVLLGQGGMGAVYRGRDPELDRPVAIKVMLDATPDFVARFRREAQSIARLTHQNIVQVYDFGVDDEGNPYFVMELIDGTPLDAIVRERGRLPPMEAIRLIKQAAEGLGAAHRAGIVHRDVKPSNLIVDGRGLLKLVDFGIARVQTSAGAALTGAAALMGTPGYMAPEQAAGKPVDARADIYALGLTLFELLAGQPPFQADDPISLVVKNMQEPLPDLRITGFGIPDELVRLVEMMGAKDPGERIQSCEAVIAALDDLYGRIRTGQMPVADAAMARTDQIPPTNVKMKRAEVAAAAAPPAKKSSPMPIIAAAVVVVLAGGGFAAWKFTQKPTDPVTAGDKPPPDKTDKKQPVVENARPVVTTAPPTRVGQGVHTGPLRVAVLKFANVGKDAKLASLEAGIGESAVTELAGASKNVALIERADIDSEVKEIDRAGDFHFDALTIAQSGKLEGIEYAVQGGFQRVGKQVRITARFVKVETGEILDTVKVDGTTSDIFETQDKVAKQLKTGLLALAEKEKR